MNGDEIKLIRCSKKERWHIDYGFWYIYIYEWLEMMTKGCNSLFYPIYIPIPKGTHLFSNSQLWKYDLLCLYISEFFSLHIWSMSKNYFSIIVILIDEFLQMIFDNYGETQASIQAFVKFHVSIWYL